MTEPAMQTSNIYRATFERYLLRNIRALVAAIEAQAGGLTDEQQAQAIHTLQLALAQTNAWPQASELMLALAPKVEQAGLREEWMELLRTGMRIAHEQHDYAAEAACGVHLAFLLQLRGELAEAKQSLLGVLARVETHDKGQEAAALNRLAYVTMLQGADEEAAAWAGRAAALVADRTSERAQNEFVWGVLAHRRQAWPEAATRFQRALALWESVVPPQPRMVAWNLVNLGTAWRGMGRHAEAGDCYRRAIDLLDALDDPVHAALARMNLGNIYLFENAPAQALECYAAAEPVFRRVHDGLRLALVYSNQGIAWQQCGDLARAERFLRAAVERWEQIGDPVNWAETMSDLAAVVRQQGDAPSAATLWQAALARLDEGSERSEVAALRATILEHLSSLIQTTG